VEQPAPGPVDDAAVGAVRESREVAPAPVAPAPATPAEVTPVPELPASEGAPATDPPARRRGRPRGRPRREVHFHVDPDEERLLLSAVEIYGSQQKALVAALEALEEAESLRDEIAELKRETERQRALLAKAESLFTHG